MTGKSWNFHTAADLNSNKILQKQNSFLLCASLQVWMISLGSEWIEYVWSKHSVPWIIIINIQSKVGKGRQFVTPPCDPLFLINQNVFAQWPGSMRKFLRNSGFAQEIQCQKHFYMREVWFCLLELKGQGSTHWALSCQTFWFWNNSNTHHF